MGTIRAIDDIDFILHSKIEISMAVTSFSTVPAEVKKIVKRVNSVKSVCMLYKVNT